MTTKRPPPRLSRAMGHGLFVLIMTMTFALVMGGGCADENAVVGGSCAGGFSECTLRCVDLLTNPANCGACGNACPAGVACSGGRCGGFLDATLDGNRDGNGDGDSEEDPNGDGSNRFDGSRRDGASDADDGSPNDGNLGDGPLSDGNVGDGPLSDGSNGDGGCSPPFNTPQRCGTCTNACSFPNTQCHAVDGGFACAPPCVFPLVECANTCVDTTSDPLHCGRCNNPCASNLCVTSICVGASGGHIVAIGHDYLTTRTDTAQARVLTNAVFIPSGTVRIMLYERYAEAAAMTRVEAILNGHPRTKVLTHTSNDADIPAMLRKSSFEVLLVYDQASALNGDLTALGASWGPTVATFTQAGGVVVVLDGNAGTVGQMPNFMTASGLLAVTGHTSLAIAAPLTNLVQSDAVGNGVLSPYGADDRSVRFMAEPATPSVVYVIFDSAGGQPVVIDRTVP